MISVAAELAGVHPQTLRIYERKGLLDPARTAGGSRRYSEIDIERLRRIAELTDEGLNLAGVKRVLELEAEVGGAAGAGSSELQRAARARRRAGAPPAARPRAARRRPSHRSGELHEELAAVADRERRPQNLTMIIVNFIATTVR